MWPWVKTALGEDMAKSRRTSNQLTLFDCVGPQLKRSESDTEASAPKQTAPKKARLETDSASLPSQVPFTGHQTNYITVDNPSAPTTVVVNASSPNPVLWTWHAYLMMTVNTRCGNLERCCAHTYTQRPSMKDCRVVASALIRKYEFLKDPGSAYCSMFMSMHVTTLKWTYSMANPYAKLVEVPYTYATTLLSKEVWQYTLTCACLQS